MSRSPFSRLSLCAAAIGALAITALVASPSRAAEDAVVIPAPAMDVPPADGIQTVVIAGGCFWGVQGVFQHTAGVVNAVSGYAGGGKSTASYETVSTGTTGHAESVQIKYDPEQDQLRQDPADLLLGRARPDAAEPPGSGQRHPISLGDLHHVGRRRRRLRTPISRSSTPPRFTRSRS